MLLDKLDIETINKMKQRHVKSDKNISEFIKGIWREVISNIRIIRQTDSVKMVIVDLDGTLWRGVLAERGYGCCFPLKPNGTLWRGVIAEEGRIDVNYLTEGWPMGFVEALMTLKQRGILLAICSKNNEEIIRKRWKDIFYGRLDIEDFACVKINWNDKANNILEILDATNLLPSNVVFIDDNPRERAWVKMQFPDMRVLGGNYYDWRRILLYSAETQRSFVSDESKRKTEMVKAQVRRVQDMAMISRDEFLAGLDLQIEISLLGSNAGAGKNANREDGNPEAKRALELLNKTNQFNTTGKRWDESEFMDFLYAGRVFIFSAKDKYSNYGIVGVICELNSKVEQMVMSCRVFGLDVETAVTASIYESFYAPNPLGFRFEKTEKNMPAQNFLNKIRSGGFDTNNNSDEIFFKINSPPEFNDKINVLVKKA